MDPMRRVTIDVDGIPIAYLTACENGPRIMEVEPADWIPKQYPTISIRIMNSGSISSS
jgi:hypothetical protein